jgi:hypothetical protein
MGAMLDNQVRIQLAFWSFAYNVYYYLWYYNSRLHPTQHNDLVIQHEDDLMGISICIGREAESINNDDS